MSSFDNLVLPVPTSKKPALHPAGGKREDILNTIAYEHIQGKNNKPHFNIKFSGLILYTSVLSLAQFKSKYDDTFVEYCLKTASPATVKKGATKSNTKILEAIVYIQELCACLPQPENAETYFKKMKEFSKTPQSIDEAINSLRDEGTAAVSLRQLKQIQRYPKAYMALNNEDGKKTPSLEGKVQIAFPYNFDYSYGVIIE
jgi:hypothetical protein